MKKNYTIEDIAEYLQDDQHFEWDTISTGSYYLFIDEDGDLVGDIGHSDYTFTVPTEIDEKYLIRYDYENVDMNWSDFETLENPVFKEICKDFLEQLNDYFE